MLRDIELLAKFTFDCWLLARIAYGADQSTVDGQTWERAVGDLLRIPELPSRQRSGLTTLFTTSSVSGVPHELDACSSGGGRMLILECKSQKSGVLKADVALFHEKTLDFYFANLSQFSKDQWWRILASSTPVSDSVRTFCVYLGIILVDPKYLPLPNIYRTASRPVADIYLREPLLQDAVRLGEIAQLALQQRWVYDEQSQEIKQSPNIWNPTEIQDLLWLQRELGSDILNLYALYRPSYLTRRAQLLHQSLRVS
ncbi:MAG: hypothetical protein F4W92_08945 [Gammaproteobacteria bacterium]|nr:hypothetical protein [Gammaproteobacteria bacterium]